MIKDYPEMLTPADMAEIMGTHPNTVRRQCHDGVIPHVKIGQRIGIPRDLVFREILDLEANIEQ